MFVAGKKDAAGTEFWAHLAATMDPSATLDMKPTDVMADPQLLGQAPPADGWGLPASYPTTVSAAYGNPSALLDVKFGKASGGELALRELTLKVFTTAPWTLYSGFTVTTASMEVYIQDMGPSTPLGGYIQLCGRDRRDTCPAPLHLPTRSTCWRPS